MHIQPQCVPEDRGGQCPGGSAAGWRRAGVGVGVDAGVLSPQGSASTPGGLTRLRAGALRAVSFMLFRGGSNPCVWLKSQRAQKAFNTK